MPAARPNARSPARITIRDVAAHAGLSRATVSLVLNNVPGARIPPETQERVRASAAALGFRPNALARALSTARSMTIGCVTDSLADPQVAAVLAAAQKLAWQRQEMLLLAPPARTAAEISERASWLAERRVDRLLLCLSRPLPPDIRDMPALPLAIIAGWPAAAGTAACDEKESARQATALLLATGHRKIACLVPAGPDDATQQAIQGYRYALAEAGLDFDPALELMVEGEHGAFAALGRRLAGGEKMNALFCLDEATQAGAVAALKAAGIAAGSEMPVVTRVNRLPAAPGGPGMVSFPYPAEELAGWALNRLHRDEKAGAAATATATAGPAIVRRVVGTL
ncbi:LacI family DNA-binding transcriptional regulator [Radicibacter daui]|uniref:LacI family DNA-binding transcriptional regulator n=1 Tax=Radicibacter daui TaxID=3064829 RepID=UPI004046CD2F